MVGLASRKTGRGYLDYETAPASAPLFIPQATIVHVEQAGAQEKSQPEPLPPGTLGNEGLEQALPDALGNARSIVFDPERYRGARGAVRFQPHPNSGAG